MRVTQIYKEAYSGKSIVYAFDEKACEIHEYKIALAASKTCQVVNGKSAEHIRHGITNMLTAIYINDSRV